MAFYYPLSPIHYSLKFKILKASKFRCCKFKCIDTYFCEIVHLFSKKTLISFFLDLKFVLNDWKSINYWGGGIHNWAIFFAEQVMRYLRKKACTMCKPLCFNPTQFQKESAKNRLRGHQNYWENTKINQGDKGTLQIENLYSSVMHPHRFSVFEKFQVV